MTNVNPNNGKVKSTYLFYRKTLKYFNDFQKHWKSDILPWGIFKSDIIFHWL